MTAEPIRYTFGVRVDDPRQALDELADSVALVDDIAAIAYRILEHHALDDVDLEDWYTVRTELRILRRRLEAIHARLSA